jgi:formylglycine-generating enzyme required for sulfatase activity
VARGPAPAEHAGPPDDDLGLSDPGIGRPDPGGTDIDGPVLATDPAGTPVQAIDDAIVAAEPTVLRRGRASTSTATAPAGDEAPAAAAAEQRAAATAPAGGTAAARALSGRTLGLAALLALLLGGALWWLRMPAGPDATPIAGPDGGTTPAGRAAADGGPADADAASAVVARADGPATPVTPATPATDAAAPAAATGYTGAEGPGTAADATSASTAPTATTLDLRVTPADAHVTLPELRQRYRPGMELQGDSVLVRIERRGFAPRVERLPLRVGANNVERTLEPASAAAASAVAAQAPAAAAQATPGTAAAGVATRDDAAPAASPARRAPGPIRRPGERFHDALASGEPGPDMVVVPAGSFRMGGSGRDETPVRNVNVQRAFAAGVHEVTFEEFDRFARATGRDLPPDQGWGRGRRPVINVSWNDARDYAAWLSAQTGQRYRLLTEAEWEYAHRAGTSGAYTFGDTLLPGRANCDGCGGTAARRSNDVGSYPPNRFGLHDTHGNVWEWVEDCYVPGYAGAPTDARARTSAGCRERVFRGGSWFFDALSMRSSKRSVFAASNRSRDLGFRVARDL